MESVKAEATLKNILSFGHLFLCCLIVFGKIIHPTSDQTASNIAIVRMFEVRGLVCLADFTKYVWSAHAYCDADFGHTPPRCPKSFSILAVGSMFDGLFDSHLAMSSNTGKVWSSNMFDRVWSPNILLLTGAKERTIN